MRWYSTVASAEKHEVTFLSCVESVLAIALSVFLVIYFDSFLHVVTAAVLAPFLLLRTAESTKRGLRYFSVVWEKADIDENFLLFGIVGVIIIGFITYWLSDLFYTIVISVFLLIGVMIVYFEDKYDFINKLPESLQVVVEVVGVGVVGVVVVGSLLSKLFATIITFFTSFQQSIQHIPQNWFRIVFCVDTLHPPELMPGIESDQLKENVSSISKLKFRDFAGGGIESLSISSWYEKIFGIFILLLTPLLFLPAIAYRLSLKSSSLIWLPLIWLIGWKKEHQTSNANQQLQAELEILRHSAWAKLTMIYAFIVVFAMTLLPLLMQAKLTGITAGLPDIASQPILNELLRFFIAFQMEAWHWSRTLVAVLSLLTFFYVDRLLIRRKNLPEDGLHSAPYILRLITLLRVPLSLFTIGCGMYLLFGAIDWQTQFEHMEWLPFSQIDGVRVIDPAIPPYNPLIFCHHRELKEA